MDNPTAFISYSWDSPVHEQWVQRLANDLRTNGVDAKLDRTLMHTRTTNVNQMMIAGVRDFDYVVIVLTEDYAKKAHALTGGAGFESYLIANQLQANMDKFIPIMRHRGDYRKVFPFHLSGIYAIDFSSEPTYAQSLDELLHRIYKVPLYHEAALGPRPRLEPRRSAEGAKNVPTPAPAAVPNLARVTEFDRDNFLAKCYSELVDMLETQLEATKRENTVFDFTLQRIHAHKAIARFYVEGNARGGIKLWLGSWGGGSTSINVAYGSVASADNDNSLNDAIRCEVGADKRLRLAMLMGSRGDKAPSTAEEVFAAVWAKVAQQIVA